MGSQAYHLSGGAPLKKRYRLGATVANAGIPILIGAAGDGANVLPTAATTAGPFIGMGLDTGTYSTVQGATEGTVFVDIRPDLVIRMLISGGATEGTALTLLSEDSGESAGLTLTDGDVPATDLDGGTLFGIQGANAGQSRSITTFSSGTSVAVTVPFLNDIDAGDTFIAVPFNICGSGDSGGDGMGDATLTTLFTQVRNDIAVGDGVDIVVVDVVVRSITEAWLYFTLRDHALNVDTI